MNVFLSLKIKNINFILILIIVLLHSQNTTIDLVANKNVFFIEEFISNGVTRMAVPLFFIISGYLFFASYKNTIEDYFNKVKKRTRSLLIPYLLWSGINIILFKLLNYFHLLQSVRKINSITDFLNNLILHPIPYQLWFIRDLYIIVLFTPLIYILLRKFKYIYILILFAIWFPNYQLYYIVDNETVLFFTIGAYFSIFSNNFIERKQNKWQYYLIIVVFWLLLLLSKYYFNNSISLYLHRLSQLVGVLVVWLGYDWIISCRIVSRLLTKYASYAFFVFLSHEPILTILKKIIITFNPNDNIPLIIYFIAPLITITLAITLAKIIERNKKIYLVLTGNRV